MCTTQWRLFFGETGSQKSTQTARLIFCHCAEPIERCWVGMITNYVLYFRVISTPMYYLRYRGSLLV
jgi:hypothetical protein